MKFPWSRDRNDVRLYRADPSVPLALPATLPPPRMTDEEIERLWRLRVLRNEAERLQAECENLVFLKPQAG